MIIAPARPNDPASIYIHIPFCAHICPYCDFTTYAGKELLIPRYVTSVVAELEQRREALAGRPVHSIFFGGGTPSLLEGDQVGSMLNAVRQNYALSDDAEISLEANPNGLARERLSAYRSAGINRLSLGAQTLDRRGLRTLGRQHESTDVLDAVRLARDAGFTQISLDLIFAWPGQTLERWESDLAQIVALEPALITHLSLYSLIIEPGTPFADAEARGILSIPDDDASAELYETAITRLDAAGWFHYEVANWTTDSGDASRHNIQYWRNGDFLGIGAGAHGTIAGHRTMNHLLPETYCRAIEADQPAFSNEEIITDRIAEAETMMLGLRLLEHGVSRNAFQQRHGRSMEDAFGSTIPDFVKNGLIVDEDDQIRLTHQGLMLANDVASAFLP
ncbi:MAG: radical SAM family heme chaperone HemW [Thermomicrobiales bacterium]